MKKTHEEKFRGPVLKAFLIPENDGLDLGAGLLLVGGQDTDGLRGALQRGELATASASLVVEEQTSMLVLVLRVGAGWEVRTLLRLGFTAINEWVKQVARSNEVMVVMGDRFGGQSPAEFVPCAVPAEALDHPADVVGEMDLPATLSRAATSIRFANKLACATRLPGIDADGFMGTVCAAVPLGVALPATDNQQGLEKEAATLH